jgi:hypothetical protein
VLAAVHHAADAISQIAATDHQAVLDAAADGRLYVPTRMLPDTYDIPQPYAPAPRAYSDALLIAYDTAADATARTTTAVDDLASAVNAPSNLLAAARRASAEARQQQRCSQGQRSVRQPHLATPVPGRTEQALLKLQIRDPALLLRAAVIDQAARDLLTEATTKAHRRDSITRRASRPAPALRSNSARTAQIAGQDVPGLPQEPLTATVRCCGGTQTGPPRRSTADSAVCASRQSYYGSH